MLKNYIDELRMPRRALPEHIVRANAKRSAVRYPVEHVFAGQTRGMGLFICSGGIDLARITISMSSLFENLQRFAWLEGQGANS